MRSAEYNSRPGEPNMRQIFPARGETEPTRPPTRPSARTDIFQNQRAHFLLKASGAAFEFDNVALTAAVIAIGRRTRQQQEWRHRVHAHQTKDQRNQTKKSPRTHSKPARSTSRRCGGACRSRRRRFRASRSARREASARVHAAKITTRTTMVILVVAISALIRGDC